MGPQFPSAASEAPRRPRCGTYFGQHPEGPGAQEAIGQGTGDVVWRRRHTGISATPTTIQPARHTPAGRPKGVGLPTSQEPRPTMSAKTLPAATKVAARPTQKRRAGVAGASSQRVAMADQAPGGRMRR